MDTPIETGASAASATGSGPDLASIIETVKMTAPTTTRTSTTITGSQEADMTNELNSKRLSDDELEAVAGGVTAPTIDPSALSNLMHANVSALLGGGGAYTLDPSTPTHTDSSTPTITNESHVVVPGDAVFGGGSSSVAPPSQSSSEPVVTGTVTLSGSLNLNLPPPPPPATVEVMTFPSSEGQFTPITPTVAPEQTPGSTGPGGVLTNAFRVSD